MRFISFNLSALVRRVRFLVAAFVCAVLVMSYALPAYSAVGSKPTEGEANLTGIEKKSQESIKPGTKPEDFNINKQQKETNPGLNEIQGTADAEKMKNPENTSGKTQSVEDIIGKTLQKVEGK